MTAAELFAVHQASCARCRAVVIEKPATLALACLEGSRLFKDAAQAISAKLRATVRRSAERAGRPS